MSLIGRVQVLEGLVNHVKDFNSVLSYQLCCSDEFCHLPELILCCFISKKRMVPLTLENWVDTKR